MGLFHRSALSHRKREEFRQRRELPANGLEDEPARNGFGHENL